MFEFLANELPNNQKQDATNATAQPLAADVTKCVVREIQRQLVPSGLCWIAKRPFRSVAISLNLRRTNCLQRIYCIEYILNMSERKVLNKYYPPDYDPSKVPRLKNKKKPNDVRIMAPFNMRCNTCGNYIGRATKFNANKETCEDDSYKGLLIFRFYLKCPRCMARIILKTNPKDGCYEVEHGATENFMALKMAEKQAQDEIEAEEEEEKINPMKHLENRTKASKQQMEASEQIQNLRSIKHRYNSVDINSLIQSRQRDTELPSAHTADTGAKNEDDDIRLEAKKLMRQKIIEPADVIENRTKGVSEPPATKSSSDSTSKKRPVISSSLMDLKKKMKTLTKK